jgi:hypothetical protein
LFKRKPEDPDPVAGRGRPLLSIELEGKPAHWSVKFADLTLSDYIVPKSSQVTAELKIKLEDSVTNPRKGIYLPTASFNHDGTKTQLSVIETTTAEDLDNKTLTFKTTVQNLGTGVGTVIFQVAEDFAPQAAVYAPEN